jgi:hypothetical protein
MENEMDFTDEYFNSIQPLTKEELGRYSTPNYLSPTSFRTIVPRLPMLTYFIQSVSIPSVVLSYMEIPAYKGLPRQQVPSTLDITDNIILNFNIDEDMKNWQEVYDWMTKLVPSNENDASVDMKSDLKNNSIIVLVYNNAKKLKKKFTFYNCFPTNLSSFEFNSSVAAIDPILISVNFDYSHFEIKSF